MHRKDFIRLSSLGFLGLCSCGTSNFKSNTNTLAIQLYTVREAISEDLEKTLEKLAGLGFSRLEIYGYNGTFFGKTRNEFQSILKNTGLKVISSHHTTGILHNDRGTLLNSWEQSVEDLHAIGAEYMVCSYLFPEERTTENYRKLPELLNQSGEKTHKAGIQFAYHNHDFEFKNLGDTTGYDVYLTETDKNLVNFEMDLYWVVRSGNDPLALFKKYPGRFPMWHVKDMDKAKPELNTEVGKGSIDFKTIFAQAKLSGMQHFFVEHETNYQPDPISSVKTSCDYIKANLI